MLAFRKTENEPVAEPPELEAATQRCREAATADREMRARLDAMKLALSLTAPGTDVADSQNMPPALREKAAPYLKLANRRRGRLLDDKAVLEQEIEQNRPVLKAARESLQGAQRRATNQIALELQPRHREAGLAMATALEALSRAMADERAVRAELTSTAPLPTSPNLPDLTTELAQFGSFANYDSPAWQWRRRLTKLGIL